MLILLLFAAGKVDGARCHRRSGTLSWVSRRAALAAHLFARRTEVEQRLHDDFQCGYHGITRRNWLTQPIVVYALPAPYAAWRSPDLPFVAVADMNMPAVSRWIGVQRAQRRFTAAGMAVQHHALPGVNGGRSVGEHRQAYAVLLVQNKGLWMFSTRIAFILASQDRGILVPPGVVARPGYAELWPARRSAAGNSTEG